MMTALVHFDPEGTRTIGAWVRPDEAKPAQFAYRGTNHEFQIGKAVIDAQPDGESWLDWCRQLAQRTPVNSWYEIREVTDTATAQDVLDAEMVRQRA